MDLASGYYWDHFQYVLRYVEKHYSEILSEEEFAFLQSYHDLPLPAQCLYLRLCSRRSNWFRINKLQYQEISDVEMACRALATVGFLQFLNPVSDCSASTLLAIFTRKECGELASAFLEDIRIPTAFSKAEAVEFLSSHFSQEELFEVLLDRFGHVVQPLETDRFEFIQFLFFGSTSRDMTDFVVRDLGHRQFMEVAEEDFIPFFSTRLEAIQKWKISRWRLALRNLPPDESLDELAMDWEADIWPMADELNDKSLGAFERSLFELARRYERHAQIDSALKLYERSLMPESLERRVRLLQKLGRKTEAVDWARVGLEISLNPKELHFFEDFVAKQDAKMAIKKVTKTLKAAEKVSISQEYQGNVEVGVIHYFQKQGFEAHFTENHLWKNLIGLLAWDLIFDLSKQSFHHPFQYAPTSFHSEEFSVESLAEFSRLLDMLDDTDSCLAHLKKVSEMQQGIMNPYVDWFSFDLSVLAALLKHVSSESLKQVCLHFWKNASTHAKGFPDLFIYRGQDYAFIEVKSPNDHLSAIQHDWHQFFREQKIEIKLLRVVWE